MINSEVALIAVAKPPSLFSFARVDAGFNEPAFAKLGIPVSAKDLARIKEIDNPDIIPLIYERGKKAAGRQATLNV